MDAYVSPFNIRDTVLCLTFLAGMVAGIVAITRRHRTAGILMLVGFVLLALDPIAEFLIFRVFLARYYAGDNYLTFNWAYVCISSPAVILGVGCLIAALWTALRSKPTAAPDLPMDVAGD